MTKLGVDIVILDGSNHLLLIKRSDDGSWSMPGGWVERHETPDNAIRRELKEETGLSIERMTLEDVTVRRSGSVHITYFSRHVSGNIHNSSESTDVRYVPFAEISPWHADHQARAQRVLEAHLDD